MNTIDPAAFNAAFKEAMRAASGKEATDATERGLTEDFCAMWPKVRFYLNQAIAILALFWPAKALALRAFVTAFTKTVLPVVCPPAP